ncbi:MAG TPA: peptidoglycan-binding domain-containing protein, partial [Candidatus Cybelea sp.]|nr:peptidoglycan-binding domain-containing protein [Candidatus Cybelea sp.]
MIAPVSGFPVRRAKYKLPVSRKRPGNFLFRLFVLVLAVFLVWLWLHFHTAPRKPAPTPNAALPAPTNFVRTPAPATPYVTTVAPALPVTNSFPRPVQNVFEAQLALLSHGISAGSLDGAIGSQTRAALAAFQLQQKLSATGELDADTKSRLLVTDSPYTTYAVTPADLARLQPLAATWLGKSQQSALDYETILELVSEKFFSHPNLIRRLNPSIDWSNVPPDAVIRVPNASYPEPAARAAFVTIHLAGKTLEAFDDATNLIAHFPCSIAKRVEKRP